MHNRQPLFLMAGGRGSSHQHILKSVYRAIGKAKPVIAYVGVANGDDRRFLAFIGTEIKSMGDCTLNPVWLASKKADLTKARELLTQADAIFMSGGDVEAGMQIVQDKGLKVFFQELADQGKLFFGASAGSIMLADQWVRWRDPDDDSTASLFDCMGLAPVICDTHAEDDDWVELKAAIQLKEDGALGYGIPSGACLIVNSSGGVEALGKPIVIYAQKSGMVVRQADLVPVRSDRSSG